MGINSIDNSLQEDILLNSNSNLKVNNIVRNTIASLFLALNINVQANENPELLKACDLNNDNQISGNEVKCELDYNTQISITQGLKLQQEINDNGEAMNNYVEKLKELNLLKKIFGDNI